MCGAHHKRPSGEEEEEQDASVPGAPDSPYAVFLSSLRPQPKGSAGLLQAEANLGEPVVVFTGPPKGQGVATANAQIAAAEAKPGKPAKPGSKAAAGEATAAAPTGPAVASVSAVPWTSMSPAALAASPPTELRAVRATALVPLPRARPRVVTEKPQLRN